MTEIISFLKGIFQGNSLSVILFILSVNLLSHLLKQLKGYAAGNERNINITHNFFMNEHKLYAGTTNNLKKLLNIVTTFSKVIDVKFGVDKCTYITINAEKQTNSKVPLDMNNLIIQPVVIRDTCKYLGQDENIAYVGEVNEESTKRTIRQVPKSMVFRTLCIQ